MKGTYKETSETILKRFNIPPIEWNGYNCNDIDIILNTIGEPYKVRNKGSYINVTCAFDIETTSFFRHKKTGEVITTTQYAKLEKGKMSFEKEAIMYIWMFGLNGFVIYGRTWESFFILLQYISVKLSLSLDKRIICFVHNLSFEFQWMKNWINWPEVFATKPFEPLKVASEWGFEFHCSYRNTNKSLELLGKDLIECKVDKKVHDLDYSLLRHSKTPLTKKELGYCMNDVKVVMAYVHEQLLAEKWIHKIPLTATGYVRRDLKEACFIDKNKKNRFKYYRYREQMADLTLDEDVYYMLKDATQGGFVHGSPYYMGETLKDMNSRDKASYYPSILIGKMLPMSSFKKRDVNTMTNEDFTRYIQKYCCLFEVKFEGLKCIFPYDDYIAKARCYTEGKVVVNNGRIHKADMIITTITEQDFFIINNWYTWDTMSISKFYTAWKGYIPKAIVEKILEYFEKKTTLKGVEGPDAEAEYMISKQRINSIFGCTITSIINKEITLQNDGTWNVGDVVNVPEALEKYNNNPGRFLYWAWGCWVTAIGRRGICATISHLGEDYVYSDTDSVKFMHPEKYESYFDEVNRNTKEEIRRALNFHKIDPERGHASTPKGDIKYLGIFEDEGNYKRFKTLGAKRYAYEDSKGLHTTVAGLGKKAGADYLTKNYDDPMKGFDSDLTVPALETGKLTHTYIDNTMEGELTDYLGNTAHYRELSGVHLAPCGFSMKVTEEYVKFCQALKYRGGELSYL